MDTVLYPVCAVVGWVASGYMLRLQRRQPSRPRRAICVALTAFATGITLAIPPIGAAIEDLTRLPNLARLLSHACVMVISTSAETMLLFLALPEAQARRSIRRWIRVTSSAFVVMVALFGYTLTYHPPVRLTVEYARVPAVTLYLLIFMAIGFFGYCVDIARLCWRFARMCGRPWLRRGLRLTAVGALFALAYSTNKIIFLIAYWLGAHPAGERDIAAVLVTIAALLMVTGLTMPAWGPALAITRRWASLRAHRRLAPLWYDLIAEFPELELDPSLRRTLPAIRDIDYTLTRRVAEIRDAQMALRPYVDRRVTALATRLAGEAGLSDDDRQAVVEAAQLAAAIQAHRAGHEAREPQPTVDLHRPTGGFRGEVAWLARVADAYRGSSIVDRGQRMTKDRYANLARIRTLDPPADYLAIYQTMMRYEFPWDMKLGLNLAFNRSFSVPRIAALHTSTGELTERTQKRIDDTGLLMYEMVLNGLEHPRGLRSLRRVNQIHRAYDIPNDDYLYVLGCLVVIPTRWLERYGWGRPCCHEREASYLFYREMGRRMGIRDIPESYETLEAWFDTYDAAQLVPGDDAAAIERATRTLLLTRIPKPLAPLGNALVSAMYDERLRRAARVEKPAWPVRAGLHLGLRTRAALLRRFARPRATALFAEGIKTNTYPDGYDIDDLGPQPPAAAHSARV